MLQKLRGNQKGFTLIELMIVIAIIGILAAIAVPQFMAYRMRGYHSVAAGDLRNWSSAQAAIMEDGATYGVVDFSTNLDAAPGSGPAAFAVGAVLAAGGRTVPESVSATRTVTGTMLTGTRNDAAGNAIDFAFPIGVGDGVELTVGLSVVATAPLYQDSYLMVTEHVKGIRAFASDSDLSSTVFFAENEIWNSSALGTFNATPPACTVGVDNLTGIAAGGSVRNPNWNVMK
jgi:prepilin-type N-terminal cleavage/methylation domain-containing protein